jgi:cardiolipin synthase
MARLFIAIIQMRKRLFYIVNGITLYRLLAVPKLLHVIAKKRIDTFKWLLGISFLTDAIDGFLARRYKVTSEFGSRLDSIADDATIAAAIIGVVVFFPHFVKDQRTMVSIMLTLYLGQMVMSMAKYGKISSFHTLSAKVAAVLQGSFLVASFFRHRPVKGLFYASAIATIIDLLEETAMVAMLPKWKADVKGVWAVKS